MNINFNRRQKAESENDQFIYNSFLLFDIERECVYILFQYITSQIYCFI